MTTQFWPSPGGAAGEGAEEGAGVAGECVARALGCGLSQECQEGILAIPRLDAGGEVGIARDAPVEQEAGDRVVAEPTGVEEGVRDDGLVLGRPVLGRLGVSGA